MKKEYKVSYQRNWSKCGTCYRQTINISKPTYKKLKNKLKKSKAKKMFLKIPLEESKNMVYFNLTQRDFFNKYLKLKLLNRNTCFCIIDVKYYCPKCGNSLKEGANISNTDYFAACTDCDEDFYKCELLTKENKSRLKIIRALNKSWRQ